MYKLREIFDFEDDSNNESKNSENKDTQLERMKHLNEVFQTRGEFKKTSYDCDVDEDKVSEEYKRLKKLSEHRIIKEYGNDGIPYQGMKQAGYGETVNTFLPTIPDAAKNTSFSYIKPSEALEISIKRTLESGTPINNMGFYDEVNWNLNNLGFDSKLPVDIKNTITKMFGGELDSSVE